MKNLELKIPPLIITFVFGFLIYIMPNPYKLDPRWPIVALSITLLIGGLICSILGVLQFKRMKTTVNPMNPMDSNKLVVDRIYQYSRNPMYLGFLLWLLSLGLFSLNPLSVIIHILFIGYMNTFQIKPEERALEKRFGSDYLCYKRQVRRWL